MNDLIQRAQAFSHAAHDSIGHKRNYTDQPYWVHEDEVAAVVASVRNRPEMIAAAQIHDVLEDVFPKNPYYSAELVLAEFGAEVHWYTVELTDIFTTAAYPEWNRAKRKLAEAVRLGQTSSESQSIKFADIYVNSRDILVQDPKFAKVYLAEKRQLLEHMKLGDPRLRALAEQEAFS